MAAVIRRRAASAVGLTLFLGMLVAPVGAGDDARAPDLGGLEKLRVPEGDRVAFRAYAEGVQIYRWDGASWTFVAPEALLYSWNQENSEVVGLHYGGPTWESVDGSKVTAAVLERYTPDPDAIPWLLLGATSNEGDGIFRKVDFIQRLFTTGGLAPAEPGDFVGEEARIPYTAWYVFYR